MKLIIAEYLRTLRERDELDRLLPDLLLEMNYLLVARPETGNRQYGVDIAARGTNKEGKEELLLLVVKQGDIGRSEWDGKNQAVRQSINEIFDVYLRSHLEPADKSRELKIIVATNGELKQTVQVQWTGFVEDNKERAKIEFWGNDKLATLVEKHLLDEHIFADQDRTELRRALALSGDAEYDRADFHRILLRHLDLTNDGKLIENAKTGKQLVKSLKVIHLAAKLYSAWTLNENADARQGLYAIERTILWSWHRLTLSSDKEIQIFQKEFYSQIWATYFEFQARYVLKLQPYYYTRNSIHRSFASSGAEASIMAFEQIGLLSSFILNFALLPPENDEHRANIEKNMQSLSDCLINWINNNGIASSPCLDKHSNDISFAMMALLTTNKIAECRSWLRVLVRNIDYAYKAKKYVPISNDSLEDLIFEGGWVQDRTSDRLMNMSWTLATLAGWAVVLNEEHLYNVISEGSAEDYPNTTLQLWHPENDIYETLYFENSQFKSGASEAPILLPEKMSEYREQMLKVLESDLGKVPHNSMAAKLGLLPLDFIACRHFGTPVPPLFWYEFLNATDSVSKH